MLKRFLFVLLLLGFVISVPYEVSAAPKKDTRKERRERRKREREERKRQQTQPKPAEKKIIPTLEEKLTPAQVNRKIQTIRRRIETAPEDRISTKNKKVLLDVFDDMVQTQMGRYIFEKAHPNLSFRIKQTGQGANGSYSYGKQCVNLGTRVFEKSHNAQTPEKKLEETLYIAHVIAHETTHSIQHSNNMNNRSNMSFAEAMTIHKILELHSILNETIVRYQIGNLPKHRHLLPNSHKRRLENIPGKTNLVPMHLFFRELKEAKMATGADEKTAERFARTKFVETFWQNNGEKSIQVGDKTVDPTISNVSEVSFNWNETYTITGFKRLIGRNTLSMRNSGIDSQIQHFIDAMNVDITPSFFRNPKTTPFNMPHSGNIVLYANGVRDMEIDALATGVLIKGYEKDKLYFVRISVTRPDIANQNRSHTEYHDGTQTKRANYTYKNGKMNGIYREYDIQGVQTMEMPVMDDVPHGDGWILENGIRVPKKIRNGYWYNRK